MLCRLLLSTGPRCQNIFVKTFWNYAKVRCKEGFILFRVPSSTFPQLSRNTLLLVGGAGFAYTWRQKCIAHCDYLPPPVLISKREDKAAFSWDKLLGLLRSELWLIIGSITAALIAAYLNVKISLCLGDFVNVMSDILKHSEEFVLARFKEPSVRLLTLYLCQAASTFAYISILSKMGENIAVKLKCQLFETLIKQDIAFFDGTRTSELVDCITSDVQEFKSTFKQTISQGVRSIAQISGSLISIFIVSPTMTLSILVVVPAVILIGTYVGNVLRKISNKAHIQSLKASTLFEEVVSNIRTVRAFANEDNECLKYKEYLEEAQRLHVQLGCGIGVFQAGTNLCLNTLVLGSLYLGCYLMSLSNLQAGDLMTFMVSTQTIQRSFAQLSLLYGHSIKGKEALKKIFFYCRLVPTIPVHGGLIIDDQKFSPNVLFENVTFSYPTRPNQAVLKGLNLEVPAGKKVAIVGTSGNGKTTIANLLERFYDVDKGRVLVGYKDVRELDPSWLRGSVIGIINQEPILFAASIKENIRYGKPNATDQQIVDAAKQANADEFIRSFPDGYETVLGERGITISGGQKQRIAIARALIKNPSILILDEATSALDPESENVVKKTIEEISQNRTVLIIAHRLTTVQNADLIVVLNRGEIVEMGTHKSLCAKRGLYWELMNKPN